MSYFTRFFAEKNLPESLFTVEHGGDTHLIGTQMLIVLMQTAPASEQAAIKRQLIRLDFINAPITPFLQHLAECYVRTQYPAAVALAA